MLNLINQIVARAKANRQRIVLPEGTEERTLKAANMILTDEVADLILLGKPAEINELATKWGLGNIGKATIIDPETSPKHEEYAQLLCELRKKKGMTIEEARKLTSDPLFYGCLMIKSGDADGQLAGARNTTGNVLRPTLSWEKIFPQFTEQISQYAGKHLTELLTCNFSTTTSLEKVASEITIMEAVKPYFEFIIIRIVCGIPEITLEGTPEDWEKLLHKARGLKEYKLDWWISELEPLLEEFVKASKGEVNKDFWRNMFKYHSQKRYGAPNIIDGWIVKFFPYDKEGKRNNLKQLEGKNCLPDEIVKVDVKYQEVYGDAIKETPLEFWAGFIGLEQNSKTFALRPQIGWMVRKKDVNKEGLKSKLSADAQKDGWGSGINIRVKEFPAVLLELKEIKRLDIQFINTIDIPDEISKIKIGSLNLHGKITKEGIERIKRLLPDTDIKINGSRGGSASFMTP